MELEAWRAKGSRWEHNGRPVFYVDEGDPGGLEPLLCIHGFPTSSYDWRLLWEGLTRGRRVIAPDLIGFGFSAKPTDYPYSILDQADLVEGLLAHLGVERVDVLAHDYGDTVAQELLARDLERHEQGGAGLRLRSVVLLNGGLFPETHRALAVQRLLLSPVGPLLSRLVSRRAFGRSFSAVFGPSTQPSEEELDRYWQLVSSDGGARIGHRLIRYMPERIARRARWVGALQRTEVPVRLVDGMLDPVSGAHMVARYRELVGAPDVVELAAVGHYPQLEAPAETMRAVLDFLG